MLIQVWIHDENLSMKQAKLLVNTFEALLSEQGLGSAEEEPISSLIAARFDPPEGVHPSEVLSMLTVGAQELRFPGVSERPVKLSEPEYTLVGEEESE